MKHIRVLPAELANQIAAGEVVERPASVVKELVENALDAGSRKINVTLEEGGLSLIRVRDDGTGMTRADAAHAFMRHATSKIATNRDLFRIRTLGFRGEALPSIAAVSKLECRTRSAEESIGTEIVWKGGRQESIQDIAHSEGTDIVVRQLFYNTPARLKYLKTVNTEISHVADTVNRLALAYPHVSFELKHEGRTLLHTLGDGRLLHVIQAIYGQTVARAMLKLEGENIDFTLQGYVGKPEITRASRRYISLLINGRVIRSYPLTQAVLEAYRTLLPVNRLPIAILSLQMDPKLVDVNVHPAKLEVRFSKEKELKEWLRETIRDRLLNESLIPQMRFNTAHSQPMAEQNHFDFRVQERQERYFKSTDKLTGHGRREGDQSKNMQFGQRTGKVPVVRFESGRDSTDHSGGEGAVHAETAEHQPEETLAEGRAEGSHLITDQRFPDLTPLAQVHGTYIVAQSEDSLFIIDQHAAHERIYYEYFRRQLAGERNHQQELLIPVTIELTASENETIKEKRTLLTEVGIELEPFGPHSYLVRSHPVWFPKGSEETLIREFIDWVLQHHRLSLTEMREESAKQMACKAAIKANRHLRQDEMETLMFRLQETTNPFTCPHGRPVLIEFTSYEMEKMFKRIM